MFLRSGRTVDAGTGSVRFPTAKLSPVRGASFTRRLATSKRRTSAGTFAPASMTTTSPGTRFRDGMREICPSRTTWACGAASALSAWIAFSARYSWKKPNVALKTTITKITIASYHSSTVPRSPPITALTIAAMMRTTTSGSTNCPRRMRRGEIRRSWTSSFGPYRARRRRASSGSSPSGLASRRSSASSARRACHVSLNASSPIDGLYITDAWGRRESPWRTPSLVRGGIPEVRDPRLVADSGGQPVPRERPGLRRHVVQAAQGPPQHRGAAARPIRVAERARQERVAGEDAPELGRVKAHGALGVSRGVHHPEFGGPDLHDRVLLEEDVRLRRRRWRPHFRRDWRVVRHVVVVPMRVQDELELEPELQDSWEHRGGGERRVDEHRLLRVRVIHEVDVVLERGDDERFDFHGRGTRRARNKGSLGPPACKSRGAKGHVGGRVASPMGTGGLNYVCPNCGNPLFFTFRVVETKDGLKKRIHCPGCRTVWVVDLKMVPEKAGQTA